MRNSSRAAQPQVGIVFMVGDKLFIESTPIDEADVYGDFLVHSIGHDAYWERLRQAGAVTGEYDDWPRGRVAYDTRTGEFTLLADRCILLREDLASEILSEMYLPAGSMRDTDEHYRCPACMRPG
jgi:hypothetical protein